jgi:DNA-binding GntR family transcriptional regulator
MSTIFLDWLHSCILTGVKKKAAATRSGSDGPIRDRAYLHIQRKIASGALAAGSPLSELALAKELGSSRTPVREAIGQLVAEGLLEQTPNRGAVVIDLSRQDIVDLYELREALEVYAVGKAARQSSRPADIQKLRDLCDSIASLQHELEDSGKNVLSIEQMRRFVTFDLHFHTLLMRMAANARILRIVNETRLLIRIFAMRHRGHDKDELANIQRAHKEVLDAVAERQPDRAMRLIAEHIQASGRERLDEFDHWERENSLDESVPVFFALAESARS